VWIRDLIVGFVYLIGGTFLLFDGFLAFRLGTSDNGAPTAAPDPIVHFLFRVFSSTTGQSNAALVVAAAMVFVGIISVALAGQESPEPGQAWSPAATPARVGALPTPRHVPASAPGADRKRTRLAEGS
jgi:hypothetical protein